MSISQALWSKFKSFHLDFFRGIAGRPITWRRLNMNYDRFGEGDNKRFTDISLMAVIGYNDFRTWPSTLNTDTGILDKGSMYLLFNREDLKLKGYINNNGNLDFDPINDRFIVDGIEYRPDGDTNIALAFNDPMYYMVIISREVIRTGTNAR